MSLSKPARFGNLSIQDVEKGQEDLQNSNTIKNKAKSERIFHEYLQNLGVIRYKSLADPGGAAGARPSPKGPDSFVLTYKFFET